jgi:hypothetical protein
MLIQKIIIKKSKSREWTRALLESVHVTDTVLWCHGVTHVTRVTSVTSVTITSVTKFARVTCLARVTNFTRVTCVTSVTVVVSCVNTLRLRIIFSFKKILAQSQSPLSHHSSQDVLIPC